MHIIMLLFLTLFLASPTLAQDTETEPISRAEVAEALNSWAAAMEAMSAQVSAGEYSRAEELLIKAREERDRAVELLRKARIERDRATILANANAEAAANAAHWRSLLDDYQAGCYAFYDRTANDFVNEGSGLTNLEYPFRRDEDTFPAADIHCIDVHLLRDDYDCTTNGAEKATVTHRSNSRGTVDIYEVWSPFYLEDMGHIPTSISSHQDHVSYGEDATSTRHASRPYVRLVIETDGSGYAEFTSLHFGGGNNNTAVSLAHESRVDFTLASDGTLEFDEDFYEVTDGKTALGLNARKGGILGVHVGHLYERLPDLADGTVSHDTECVE